MKNIYKRPMKRRKQKNCLFGSKKQDSGFQIQQTKLPINGKFYFLAKIR